jgi:CheY-like chemotaxis protein/two-component sensor histidine kinase
LLALVNDILDISRLEAGKFSLHMSALDIREALQETLESLRLLANQKSLSLTFTDHVQAPLWVEIDLKVTRQILINLVGNAIKFTDEGGVTIEFNAREIDDKTICLQFDVVDTGAGMTQEESARVFDRFEQSGSSLSGEQIGAGLGLAIVKDLVTLLGGDVTCLTAKGRGSRFSVSFPVTKLANPPQSMTSDSKVKVDDRPLEGLNIIAVDDNAINRIIIGKTCETLGANIDLFEAGDDMIAHLSEENAPAYDVMLLDLNMPGKNGFETLEAVRHLSTVAAKLPAIALTADAIDGTEEKVRAAGMEGYVTKPINAQELAEAILLLTGNPEEDVQ